MAIVQRFLRFRYPLALWIILLVVSTFLLSPVLPETIYRVDPLALLSATLRTYQRAGCDSEQLSLSCPRGTSISIELAQYGRAGDLSDINLCPPISDDDAATSLLDGVVHSGTEIEVKPPENCLWPNALQYTLLQTVVEACQKKRHCKFEASPKSVIGDPCPGIRKFVEIAYKCRPYEFRSKVACENDVMQLICNPYSRIAIYSASFGRQEYESVQCSQPQGTKEETCLVSYATETVMQICHGRRRCILTADSSTFGKPCKTDIKMYLKVVYTCIPRKVLKDRYETTPEQDEPQQIEFDMDQDDLYDEDQFYKESEAIPPAPKLQGGLSNPSHSMEYPYGVGGGIVDSGSSIIPPILSRNDSSLEVTELTSLRNEFINTTITLSRTTPTDEVSTNSAPYFTTDINFFSSNNGNEDTLLNTITTSSYNNFLITKSNNIFETKETQKILSNLYLKQPKFIYLKQNQKLSVINSSKDSNGSHIEPASCVCDNQREKVHVIGFVTEWMQTYEFLKQNQERFYLYLIISVTAGVLLCLTLVIGRLIIHKRNKRSANKGEQQIKSFQQSTTCETQLPNGFSDDISEIDADIDLTTSLAVPSVSLKNEQNYITYTPSPSPYDSSFAHPNVSHTSTTMLVPGGGLIMTTCGGNSSGAPNTRTSSSISGSNSSGGIQQSTPPSSMISTSMGPSISGAMEGSMMPISSVPHHATPPSYISGALMVSSHGTLRRPMIPTSGCIATPSTLGITSGNTICYDGTLPRSLSRAGPTANQAYFYG